MSPKTQGILQQVNWWKCDDSDSDSDSDSDGRKWNLKDSVLVMVEKEMD